MKNIFLFSSLCCWAVCNRLSAQDLNAYSFSLSNSVIFEYPCGTLSGILTDCEDMEQLTHTEAPPWIIGGGGNWRSYFLTDGIHGAVASAPLDMNNYSVINFKDNGTGPVMITAPERSFPCLPTDANDPNPWRRNYYGVWTAQYLNHPTAGTVSLGFTHSENKFRKADNQDDCTVGCEGSINPRLLSYPAPECYKDYYPTYSSFVCGVWIPNTQATNWGQQYFPNDMGPITWPSSGYLLSSGQKAAIGCGSPSSIIWNGYIYVFYKDASDYVVNGDPPIAWEDGRHPGIKVVRAPLSDALNPTAYRAFYEDAGGNQYWNPSLPPGFTKEHLLDFVRQPGPLATNILESGGAYDYLRFSVAQVTGTDYFLGVASYNANGGRVKAELRWSRDLVHWHDSRVIEDADAWSTAHLNYPIFMSFDGWTNTTILPNDFFVVGTTPDGPPAYKINNVVNKMHVYIPAPPPPPPPPPPPCIPGVNAACPDTFIVANSHREAMDADAATILDLGTGKAPGVYPNPGTGVYHVSYTLKEHAVTQLNVLDLTGRKLQVGPAVLRAPGQYTETVNISAQARGMYLLELLVNGGKKTFKVIYE